MICTDCEFICEHWKDMKEHYEDKHPDENPYKYFRKEARLR